MIEVDGGLIIDEWIRQAIELPVETSRQADGKIRMWSYIQEADSYFESDFDEGFRDCS